MMKHLAIIPDGNRRWARERSLPTFEGHRRGYDKVKDIGLWCLERGIEHVSVWGFSTENWKRSAEEVGYLMDLLHLALTKEIDFYNQHDIRLKVIGRREGLPEKVSKAIQKAETETGNNTRGQVNLLVNYGGRAEIVDGVKALLAAGIKPEEITEETLASSFWTAGIPDPDVIVRTSGEKRLSGYYTWGGVYSELMFLDKHFPDFDESDLDFLIQEFEQRDRRYGGDSKGTKKPSA